MEFVASHTRIQARRALWVLVGLAAAGGCGSPALDDAGVTTADADPDGRDAGRGDAASWDAAPPVDAGAADWTRLRLLDGDTLEGELIATYDHSIWWWTPSDQRTFAVFDPRGLAPWPDDRSTRFISSRDLLSATPIARPPGVATHRSAMRERGVLLERAPFDGVVYVITGAERYHKEESGYGDFAWDLTRHDDSGRQNRGSGLANEDYYIWDEPVQLPTGGIVVEVADDAPDLPPGPPDRAATNNFVGVQIYGGFYIYLLHLRQGSVPPEVVVGARLETGAIVGRVGNSGVSAEPHLHVAVLAYDASTDPPRTWSVPAEWRDVWLSRGRRASPMDYAVPVGGDYVSSTAF